ncbi:MAG: hypothetical protein ACD_62C00541G0004 [uncultured bacterium]|nr:MAG: hypothetical protein ACD_62C00541G0004 [uncultured bacterium]
MWKHTIYFIVFFLWLLTPALLLAVDEPLPPGDVLDWLDYSLRRFPPDDCPSLETNVKKCAGVTQLDISGDITTGKLLLEFTGYNWSRQEQRLDLVGPNATVALTNSQVSLAEQMDPLENDAVYIAPFFDEAGGFWKITVPPGKFMLKAIMTFAPQSVLTVNLADGIGTINSSKLIGGHLQFDQNTGNHGGTVQFMLAGKQTQEEASPQVRGTRVFQWGNIPTFTYVISVSGLHSETPVTFPLLGYETIEKISPTKPYRVIEKNNTRYLETTFSPSQTELEVSGHYTSIPSQFTLGATLPFEVWIFLASRRHPVNIQHNANPIDPTEFSHLIDTSNARAFLIKPGQKMAFYPVGVQIEEGQKGTGNSHYRFFEGHNGLWLEKLFLNAQVPQQDRLVIPTPGVPIYAGIGDEGIELYHVEKDQLSVRLPQSGLDEQPIVVDWRNTHKINPVLSLFRAILPGQKIATDKQTIDIMFQPGHVPLLAWGTSTSRGDLLDQFHLYGLLIGVLAFFICRGLKFGYPLSLLVTLLCIGLYQVPRFPLTWVLATLIITLPLSLMKDEQFTRLKTKRFRLNLMILIWACLFITTTVQLTGYSRDRIFSALHPYAGYHPEYDFSEQTAKYDNFASAKRARPMLSRDELKDISTSTEVGAPPEAMPTKGANVEYAQMQLAAKEPQNPLEQRDQDSEWTAKPVSVQNSMRGGALVEMTNLNLAPDTDTNVKILVAGSWLRAFWLLLETVIILSLMVALLTRGRKLL